MRCSAAYSAKRSWRRTSSTVGLGAPAPIDKGFVVACCIAGLQAQHPGELALEVADCVFVAGTGALGDGVVVGPVAFGGVIHAENGRAVEPPVWFTRGLHYFVLRPRSDRARVHRAHWVCKPLEERCEQLVGAGGMGEEGRGIGLRAVQGWCPSRDRGRRLAGKLGPRWPGRNSPALQSGASSRGSGQADRPPAGPQRECRRRPRR